jgi:hypothetical protein
VQSAALLVCEVITFVVGNQVDNRAFGQGCRLVENKAALLDTCSEWAHAATVRLSHHSSQAFKLPDGAHRLAEARWQFGSNWLALGTPISRATRVKFVVHRRIPV